jgi:hypothetical protein
VAALPNADRADDEGVVIDRAAGGQTLGEQEQESGGNQESAVAHAELAVAERPPRSFQPRERPAAKADRETLEQKGGQAHGAAGDQDLGVAGLAPGPVEQGKRRQQQQRHRRQPDLAVEQDLSQRRGVVVICGIAVKQPFE